MTRQAVRSAAGTLPVILILCSCSGDVTTPTAASTSPATTVFASQFAARGDASRSFSVSSTGSIEITLTSVTPETVVGLGIGIPRADGANCNLSQSLETGPGSAPQIVAAVDGGTYCVKVYDIGSVRDSVNFSVTLVHP